MNHTSGPDSAERTELARLLPAPGKPELPAGRHLLLKEAFMQQITEPAVVPSRRSILLAAPVAAAVLVATLAIGVTVLDSRATGGPSIAADSPRVVVAAGDAAGVAPLMERVALVAGKKPRVPVGDDEYVYIKSRVAWLDFVNDGRSGNKDAGVDPMALSPVRTREIWRPASQGSEGLVHDRGDTFGLHDTEPNSYYATLPTDPAALLQQVYVVTEGQGHGADAAAFDFIGTALRESLLPPQVAAALYRAAAKIPGVVLVADSVDAEGRHGVAVARTDEVDGQRREWIFNPATFEYLGERSYLVRDTDLGKAGTLTGTTAVLQRGVVRKKGELPE
ncbi:CU044_5270 family protein [Actinoplanes subglobosus]|uniref:CU044_5270 family protein n=1 Tax=Actinoplanes subglobosus TaxID=1547892 RepID=A0ABV8J761_9ACTN